MPNNIHNKLSCCEGDLKEIITFLAGNPDQIIDFNKVCEEPLEFTKTADTSNNHEIVASDAESMRLIELYEADNRLDWRCKNWGTKTNACDTVIHKDYIRFNTAWVPPFPFLEKLSALFPNHVFEVEWEEEVCGAKAGQATLQAGEVIKFNEIDPERAQERERSLYLTGIIPPIFETLTQ